MKNGKELTPPKDSIWAGISFADSEDCGSRNLGKKCPRSYILAFSKIFFYCFNIYNGKLL